ncbi:MAG: energy transducer TonB [Bacteroidetes bacterium]|nr:energy transducer TonB [Bacteroidota bacterium]
MKVILFGLWISYLYPVCNLYSQSSESDNLAENPKPAIETYFLSSSNVSFEKTFDINLKSVQLFRLITDARIMPAPGVSPETSESVIPAGVIIEAYKYFPKDAVWAVKYDNQWGFIPVTQLVPFGGKDYKAMAGKCDEPPEMITDLKLDYPTEALINGITGTVKVRVLISKTGAVLETEVIEGIRGLDDAAVEGINKLKFKPGKYLGKPVNAWIDIPVLFELTN